MMQMPSQRATDTRKWALIALIAAVVAFLVGFGWQFVRASGLADDLEIAERNATFNGLEGTLAAATIEAQQGSFEVARQYASDFFSGLQNGIPHATDASSAALQDILAERDATITSLSRSSPESGPLLARMFNRYRAALGKPVGPLETEPAPAPTMDPSLPADTPHDTTPPTTTTGS